MVSTDPEAGVDVSPIVVTEIEVDGVRLVAREPLQFEVSFDAEQATYDVEGPLGIYQFAETRELLLDILIDDLQIFWRDFAVGDQSAITGDAQRIGAEMRRVFAKAPDAA